MATAALQTPDKSLMQLASEQIARDNTVDPVLNTFDESKGVAGRVDSIIGKDSPLMQRAATQGTQLAAQRGLTNSTLAAEASQNAVLAAATPIASADASLYQQAQTANQQAANTAKGLNANIGATAATQGLSLDNSNTQFGKQLTEQTRQFDTAQSANQRNFASELAQRQEQFKATQQQQVVMQGLDAGLRTQLAQIDAASRTGIASNTNIAQAWGSLMSNISAIQNNAGIEAGAKQTLIQNQMDSFKAFSSFWQKTAGLGADIGDLLAFNVAAPAAAGAPTPYGPGGGAPAFESTGG